MMVNTLLQGNYTHDYVVLSCGVTPDIFWAVNIVGRKLTRGWKGFAEDNAFEDGDVLVFDFCGNWRYHVERYRPDRSNNQDDSPIGVDSRFVTLNVTADKVARSRMFLPQDFCEANDLKQFSGKNIFMVGGYGMKFPVKLNLEVFPSVQRLRLAKGLREFLEANDIKSNDEIKMELLRDDSSTPTLKLRSKVILVPNSIQAGK